MEWTAGGDADLLDHVAVRLSVSAGKNMATGEELERLRALGYAQ